VPAVKPPQPTGLMPVSVMAAGGGDDPADVRAADRDDRPESASFDPVADGPVHQRIVLPTPPGNRPGGTKSLSAIAPNGRINLPVGMILRCLPPEVLAEDISHSRPAARPRRKLACR